MILKPDVTFRQVDDPPNRWCDSGHVAPEVFARGGPDSILEPTRFFHVCGEAGGQKIDQTLCEPCCILVNYLVGLKRKERG